MKIKIIFFIIFLQQIFIIFLLFHYLILNKINEGFFIHNLKIFFNKNKLNNNYTIIEKIMLDYDNNTFAILRRLDCKECGLFSNYIVYLGCIRNYISKGYIPLIDISSFSNVYNGFNKSLSNNVWEMFFNQPFNFSLKKILKYGKNIIYFNCKSSFYRPQIKTIFLNKVLMNYWHNIANQYIPIKDTIIKDSNNIFKSLFNNDNILGVLIRGTDYVARKPKNHPIPPKCEIVIKDVILMDKNNNYDYIFIATEDDIIREKFIKKFQTKIKFYKYKNNINYNYKSKLYLAFNKNIKGNIEFIKIYLINIIILSRCIDFITARTSGAAAAFIITNGFRNNKIYFLGNY